MIGSLSTHWGIFGVSAVLFLYFFWGAAYGEMHRRTRIVSAILSVGFILFFSYFAYSEWRRHAPILSIGIWVFMALNEIVSILETIRLIRVSDPGVAATGNPVFRQPTATARTLRFGPHELFVEPDRIAERQDYEFADRVWHSLILAAILIVCTVGNRLAPKPLEPMLALFPVAVMVAKMLGALVKSRQIRDIVSVRGDRLFVEEIDLGSVTDAKVDVVAQDDVQIVRLISPGQDDPRVLVTTHDRTMEQARAIAAAIRAFLKERIPAPALPVKAVGTGP